jgi:four helix bundle protein
MSPEELKKRTKQFALRGIKLFNSLPKRKDAEVLGVQLLRASTSVGANYRAACRARSQADFISKITVVEEEADESAYWIELLGESGIIKQSLLRDLLQEANELTAIFTSSGKTAKGTKLNSQFKIRNSQLINRTTNVY